MEIAKRRVLYGLACLGCSPTSKSDDPLGGLTFEFLAELEDPSVPAVMTGHVDGVITLSLAEADDAERERRRLRLHEPYRTLLGHFRDEVGHYFWDRLIAPSDRLNAFRTVFGDERQDYAESLRNHYDQGAPPGWQERFVSAYASAHPWEDWAESWAHYLHMTDALETAAQCGLSIRPRRSDEPTVRAVVNATDIGSGDFERLLEAWFPLTYVLNNLNRGLGLSDGYPFVLADPTTDKL